MRVAIIAIAFVVGLGAASSVVVSFREQATVQAQAEQRSVLKIEGMTCSGCEAAVKIAAKQVDGVKDAKVSYAKGTAEVTYDPAKTSPDAIAKAIAQKTGYKTEVAK